MNGLLGIVLGVFSLSAMLFLSLLYLAAKKYTETLAKLSAEDYYKGRAKQ